MKIEYRKGNTGDLKEICTLIKGAIVNLERHNIFQWDNLYPDEEILREDIIKKRVKRGNYQRQNRLHLCSEPGK